MPWYEVSGHTEATKFGSIKESMDIIVSTSALYHGFIYLHSMWSYKMIIKVNALTIAQINVASRSHKTTNERNTLLARMKDRSDHKIWWICIFPEPLSKAVSNLPDAKRSVTLELSSIIYIAKDTSLFCSSLAQHSYEIHIEESYLRPHSTKYK